MRDAIKAIQHSGVTLIELLVVIAIVAIAATLGSPSFVGLINAQRVKSSASTLHSALVLTRSEAMKRNANVALSPVDSANWSKGWNIVNPDAATVSTIPYLSAYQDVGNITISGPTNVVYQGSGRVTGNTAASFTVSASGTSLTRCVKVSLSGTPSIMKC